MELSEIYLAIITFYPETGYGMFISIPCKAVKFTGAKQIDYDF